MHVWINEFIQHIDHNPSHFKGNIVMTSLIHSGSLFTTVVWDICKPF